MELIIEDHLDDSSYCRRPELPTYFEQARNLHLDLFVSCITEMDGPSSTRAREGSAPTATFWVGV